MPVFPVPFNQQPEKETENKINEMPTIIRKIISLNKLYHQVWGGHTPPFKAHIFFRSLAQKPLVKRSFCILAGLNLFSR